MGDISRKALNLTAKLDGTVQVAYAEEYVNALYKIEEYISELEAKNSRLKDKLTNVIEVGNEMAKAVRKRNHPHAETVSDWWIILLANMQEAKK